MGKRRLRGCRFALCALFVAWGLASAQSQHLRSSSASDFIRGLSPENRALTATFLTQPFQELQMPSPDDASFASMSEPASSKLSEAAVVKLDHALQRGASQDELEDINNRLFLLQIASIGRISSPNEKALTEIYREVRGQIELERRKRNGRCLEGLARSFIEQAQDPDKLDDAVAIDDAARDRAWASIESSGRLSRTITWGSSYKAFNRPAAQVREIARRNLHEAGALVARAARQELTAPQDVEKLVVSLNQVINRDLPSVTPHSGDVGRGGDWRAYVIHRDKNDASSLAEIPKKLHEISVWLFHELTSRSFDPILLAAQAHEELATVIKPFHDGNGREARMLSQYILLRGGLPEPIYGDDIEHIHNTRTVSLTGAGGAYISAIEAGIAEFARYLREAVNMTYTISQPAPIERRHSA